MSAIHKGIAVYGFIIGLLATVFAGLYFFMDTLGLVRNVESQFANSLVISGSVFLAGIATMVTIFKTLWK